MGQRIGQGPSPAKRDVTFTEAFRSIEGYEPDDTYDETPATDVYFILDAEAAQIKIGISNNVKRRMNELQSQRGRKLDLLGSLKGGSALEKAMHSRFGPYRREAREWYSSEIIPDVAELLAA